MQSIHRFLRNPAKPVILAMSRPDAKKNITTLVRAFGENAELRRIANLVLIMGNRQRIDGLAKGSQQVLTAVLKLIDEYDLYGSVAYPKAHSQVSPAAPPGAPPCNGPYSCHMIPQGLTPGGSLICVAVVL